MNRRRQLAVAFFSAVIVLVLFAIVFVESINAGTRVTVWMVKADVAAGTGFSADAVAPQQVHAQPGDFQFTTKPPATSAGEVTYQFRTAMKAGDIVRDDDLVAINEMLPLNVTISGNPAIGVGDAIDLWAQPPAAAASGSTSGSLPPPTLIGCQLRVIAANGGTFTLDVPATPAAMVAQWVALAADSTVKLYANRATEGSGCQQSFLTNTSDVIRALNAAALATPTPAASPSS